MTVFFTSDTHYFHRNVITHAKRPFNSLEEMHETMISRWNERVTERDVVYHLGDFSFGRPERTEEILARLRGTINLNPGNHDDRRIRKLSRWASVEPYREIKLDGHHVVLSHYAHRVWNRCHHGSLMLYGHSHGSIQPDRQSLDVGVDCWDFRPVTLPEILARMACCPEHVPVDHHR